MLTQPLSCWHKQEWVGRKLLQDAGPSSPGQLSPGACWWQCTPAALAPRRPSALTDLAPLGSHVWSTCRKQRPLPLEFPLQGFHIRLSTFTIWGTVMGRAQPGG